MQALAAQQRQLAAAIVGEVAVTADTADATNAADAANTTFNGLGRPERIGVYRHAYRARLAEALRSNYPVLHRVLGDDAFGDLAQAYLRARPSVRPSIRWFGDELATHMNDAPDAVPHPSLIDLARMEWSLGLSFDSADAAVLTPAMLLAIPAAQWPALRFAPHPSVNLLHLDWSVEPAWSAVTADERAEVEAPQRSSHALLVWRWRLDTRWRSLPDDEAVWLRSCLSGEPFAQLCELATQTTGDGAALAAAGALRRWVEDGLLAGLRPSAQSA